MDGWQWWLHNNVNVLHATELGLEGSMLHDVCFITVKAPLSPSEKQVYRTVFVYTENHGASCESEQGRTCTVAQLEMDSG